MALESETHVSTAGARDLSAPEAAGYTNGSGRAQRLAGTKTAKRQAGIGLLPYIGVALILLLLVATQIYSTIEIERLNSSFRWVTHTREVLQAAHEFSKAIERAEEAQRGFLLSADPDYESDFHESVARVEKAFQNLYSLTSDNPSQQQRLSELRPILTTRISSLETRLNNRKALGLEAALARTPLREGRRLMVNIRERLEDFESLEAELLQQRAITVNDRVRRARLVIITTLSLIILLGGLFIVRVNKDIRSQTEHEERLSQQAAMLQEQNAQLETVNKDLDFSNKELDDFAYIASHDLKAPLRGIINLSKWIDEDAGSVLPEESKRHIAQLQQRTSRMESLLDDLLSYSRAGRTSSEPEEVDVTKLVENIKSMLSAKGNFTIEPVGKLPKFETEKTPLETVLRNLISNAIKHHPRTDGKIRIAASENGQFYEFAVSDDGAGIPEQFHEKIFQMFQTLKPRDEVEGSGMGLAVVKKLVERYGGRVWVRSKEGNGSTFLFLWPKKITRKKTN